MAHNQTEQHQGMMMMTGESDSSPETIEKQTPLDENGFGKQKQTTGSSSSKGRSRRVWTRDEDERLRLLVSYWGDQCGKNGHWDKISSHFDNRTNKDCRKRWFHSLDPKLKRGRWTEHEDKVLIEAYKKMGPVWHRIAQLIPGRTDDQCSKRYNDVLDPNISNRLRTWTAEEDRLLLELVKKHGTRWRNIAKEMDGRTGLTCRNRWRKLVSPPSNTNKEHTQQQPSEQQASHQPIKAASQSPAPSSPNEGDISMDKQVDGTQQHHHNNHPSSGLSTSSNSPQPPQQQMLSQQQPAPPPPALQQQQLPHQQQLPPNFTQQLSHPSASPSGNSSSFSPQHNGNNGPHTTSMETHYTFTLGQDNKHTSLNSKQLEDLVTFMSRSGQQVVIHQHNHHHHYYNNNNNNSSAPQQQQNPSMHNRYTHPNNAGTTPSIEAAAAAATLSNQMPQQQPPAPHHTTIPPEPTTRSNSSTPIPSVTMPHNNRRKSQTTVASSNLHNNNNSSSAAPTPGFLGLDIMDMSEDVLALDEEIPMNFEAFDGIPFNPS